MIFIPAVDIKEGKVVRLYQGKYDKETGGVICPNCGYRLTLLEAMEGREAGAVGKTVCPSCRKFFKQH